MIGYAYKVMADIWNGLKAGLDDLGPVGVLAATAAVLVLLWLAGGAK